MAMQEEIDFVLSELSRFNFYSGQIIRSKQKCNELENELKGLKSPKLDKIGSSGGFGIVDDSSKFVKYEKRDEYKTIEVTILDLYYCLYDITQSIEDNTMKLYATAKYLEKASTKEALSHTSYTTKKRADEALKNSIGKLIDKTPKLIRELKNKKENAEAAINRLR